MNRSQYARKSLPTQSNTALDSVRGRVLPIEVGENLSLIVQEMPELDRVGSFQYVVDADDVGSALESGEVGDLCA